MEIEVENIKYKVLKKVKILHEAWELDNFYYVVEKSNKAQLVISDHGRLRFASKQILEEKLKEYQNLVIETKEALKIIYNQK